MNFQPDNLDNIASGELLIKIQSITTTIIKRKERVFFPIFYHNIVLLLVLVFWS
jgi:hypothetical protein